MCWRMCRPPCAPLTVAVAPKTLVAQSKAGKDLESEQIRASGQGQRSHSETTQFQQIMSIKWLSTKRTNENLQRNGYKRLRFQCPGVLRVCRFCFYQIWNWKAKQEWWCQSRYGPQACIEFESKAKMVVSITKQALSVKGSAEIFPWEKFWRNEFV